MKVNGVIKLGEVSLPEKSKIQVGGVEVQYEAEFSVLELKEVIDIARTLPDVVADIVRKFKAYEEEFTPPNRTQDEVDSAIREAEMARANQEAS